MLWAQHYVTYIALFLCACPLPCAVSHSLVQYDSEIWRGLLHRSFKHSPWVAECGGGCLIAQSGLRCYGRSSDLFAVAVQQHHRCVCASDKSC